MYVLYRSLKHLYTALKKSVNLQEHLNSQHQLFNIIDGGTVTLPADDKLLVEDKLLTEDNDLVIKHENDDFDSLEDIGDITDTLGSISFTYMIHDLSYLFLTGSF